MLDLTNLGQNTKSQRMKRMNEAWEDIYTQSKHKVSENLKFHLITSGFFQSQLTDS